MITEDYVHFTSENMSSEGSAYRYKEIDGLYEWAYPKAGSATSPKGRMDGYIRFSTGEEWKYVGAVFMPASSDNPDEILGQIIFSESGEMSGQGCVLYILDGSFEFYGIVVDGIIEIAYNDGPDSAPSLDYEVYLAVTESTVNEIDLSSNEAVLTFTGNNVYSKTDESTTVYEDYVNSYDWFNSVSDYHDMVIEYNQQPFTYGTGVGHFEVLPIDQCIQIVLYGDDMKGWAPVAIYSGEKFAEDSSVEQNDVLCFKDRVAFSCGPNGFITENDLPVTIRFTKG